jgi:hypothetical protein
LQCSVTFKKAHQQHLDVTFLSYECIKDNGNKKGFLISSRQCAGNGLQQVRSINGTYVLVFGIYEPAQFEFVGGCCRLVFSRLQYTLCTRWIN